MKNSTSPTRYLVLIFLLLGIAPMVQAEVKTWNTSDVLQLSDELFGAARRLSIECRTSPPKYTSESTSGHLEFRYHVRHFMSVSHDLTQALEDGKSMMETQPIFNTLVNIMTDLKAYSEKKADGPWPVVSKAVIAADDALNQLTPYYAEK